jgi:hypothetical protein
MDASVFAYKRAFYNAQLQGILYDVSVVYQSICSNGRKLPNDENAIRNEFGKYFSNQVYKSQTTTACRYYYDYESCLQNTCGRVDMRFLPLDCYGFQDVFFAIECKRLDGTGHLCKEYVDNGICRFTTGKYPTYLGCNAMLGFVVRAINLNATIDKVNSHLAIDEQLKAKNTLMTPMVSLESQHQTPQSFILYHLWIDLSNYIE